MKPFRSIRWFTNLAPPTGKRNERDRNTLVYEPGTPPTQEFKLTEVYTAEKYPLFDNCPAISVNRVKEIPKGYDGLMGVPITILDRYNPDLFEIVAADFEMAQPIALENGKIGRERCYLNGKRFYARILIRLKDVEGI